MDYLIRTVREEDAKSIIDLLNPIIKGGTYTIMDQELSVAEQVEFIRGFPRRGVFNVAVHRDSHTVVGLQSVEPLSMSASALKHVGEISTFVALGLHRSGIGRQLSETTFVEARAQGFLKLWATVRADNPPAVSFYRSQGFGIIGTARKHAFVRGNYLDEILMEQLLP